MKQQEVWSFFNTADKNQLAQGLIHTDDRVRTLTAQKIRVTRDATLIPDLIQALAREESGRIRYELVVALQKIGDASIQPLFDALKSADEDYRYAGALGLNGLGSAEVIRALCIASEDPAPDVRMVAIHSLGNTHTLTEEIEAKILRCLSDDDSDVLDTAILASGKLGCCAAVPQLLSLIDGEDPTSYRWGCIVRVLGELGDTRAVETLCTMLKISDENTDDCFGIRDGNLEADIIQSLGQIGDSRAVAPIIQMLVRSFSNQSENQEKCDPDIMDTSRNRFGRKTRMRRSISNALSLIGESSIVPLIETLQTYAVMENENKSMRGYRTHLSVTREVSKILSKMDHSVVGPILKLLEDKNAAVRKAAVDCLSETDLEEKTVRDALITLIFNEEDGEVKRKISWLLRKGGLSSFDDLVNACEKMDRPFTQGEIYAIHGICQTSLSNITSNLAVPDGEERQKKLILLRELVSVGFTLSPMRESDVSGELFR